MRAGKARWGELGRWWVAGLALAAGALVPLGLAQATGYGGQYTGGDGTESTVGNPCLGPQRAKLRCPDLRISRPQEIYLDTATRPGKRLLRATNNIRSRGKGPVEIRGIRISADSMRVNQRIKRKDGGKLVIRTTGRVDWYPIPGQYHYWKFRDAARFELWTTGGRGKPLKRIRIGPKLHYCLRDLERTRPGRRSPSSPHYPACSQDYGRQSVVLGTSVGWSDIYPATYHQNWIDVTGLRGCYAFFLVADPKNHIRELNERNNRGHVFVRLPSGRVVNRC
ncbi:MAG: lysyl oxidase family protein [Solirubrobacterales bacterium]